MLGFMITSPLVAWGSQYFHPFRIITGGLLVWSVSCMGFAVNTDYWVLVLLRALTGVGEAAFISLAPTVIVDSAPDSRKTIYMGIFFAIIPVGFASGTVYGEVIA